MREAGSFGPARNSEASLSAPNLSTIVFLASGKVDVEQAWRLLRFRRRRRVSSDLLKRLTPRQAAHDLVLGIALHLWIEHFEGATTGVGLVVMGKIREPFEHAKKVLVPRTTEDLHIAGAALRTERTKPCELVATLEDRRYHVATERAHQVKCLALTGLSRILAKTDPHPLAIPGRGFEQPSFYIPRVLPCAHHIEQPVSALVIATELDADGPIRVIELCFLGGCQIPIAHDLEVRRDLIDDGTPLPLKIQPGRRPNFPVAVEQPPALEQ